MAYPLLECTQNQAPFTGCPFTFTVTALLNGRASATGLENCATIAMPMPHVCPSPWNRLTCTGLAGPTGWLVAAGLDGLGEVAVLALIVGLVAAAGWPWSS